MFEATNYISEYNVGDKFISFQYTNGKRFAQINVCQNKKVERNKKKIEVYQEGNAPLSLSFSTEDEAIEAFDLLNTTLDTLRTNCQTTQVSVSKNGTLVGITDKLNFVAGTNTTVDVDNILGVYRIKFNNSSLQSLQAGAGIGIDITNPLSPIVYALQKMQIALTDRSNNIVASTIVHEFIVLENFEITSSPFISLVTAPTGANFILQIQKNGVEVGINTKALVVTAGTNVSTATTDFNGVTFAKGDRISFRVTQIGSVNAGKGLDILLNFKN